MPKNDEFRACPETKKLESGHTHECGGQQGEGNHMHWCPVCRRWWGVNNSVGS